MPHAPRLRLASGLASALLLALAVTAVAQPKPGKLTLMTVSGDVGGPIAAVFDPRLDFVYALGGSDPTTAYSLKFGGSAGLAPGDTAAAGRYANLIAAHPAGGRFYVVSGTDVHGYDVDPATGALTALTPVALGAVPQAQYMPASLVIDPGGRFLYVLQYVSVSTSNNDPSFNAVLSAYAIDSSTGALAALAGSPFPRDAASSDMTLSPDGRFAFITVFPPSTVAGKGTLKTFTRDTTTGLIGAAAISSISTRTRHPRSIVSGSRGTLYLAENANNNTGVDTVSVYRYSATGALTEAGSTPIPSVEQAGPTIGPYLSIAPARNLLFVNGFNKDEGNNFPGFVAAFALNADGSLPQTPVTTLQTPDVGQGPYRIANDANGSFALSVETGDDFGWEDMRIYRTDVSPLALGDALAKGPRVSFNGGFVVLTDTLLLSNARLQTVQNIENYGFSFRKPGYQQPDTQSQVYSIDASVRPTAANGNTVQGSFRVPLPATDTMGRYILNLDGYYVRTFVRVTGATYHGAESFVSVKPFVTLDTVKPSSSWGSFWLDLSGSVRPDRAPGATGFKVSNRTKTRVIPAGLGGGTTFRDKLLRDTLETMTGSTAPDTFTVVAYGVFGADTLFSAAQTITNAPVITMTQVSKTATSVLFKIAFQPWASSKTIYLRQWNPSSDKWTRAQICQADCNVSGLSSGTYTFRADLVSSGSNLFETPAQTVTLP